MHNEIIRQNKEALKKAKQSYYKDLIKQGIDKDIAKTMVKVEFDYNIKKPI